MSDPVVKTQTYRGVEFAETVDYEQGLVTWEIPREVMGALPSLSHPFEPLNRESLERARGKIQAAIDCIRGGEKITA